MLNQNARVFLFLCVSHVVFAALQQVPRYEQLLTMSALSQFREENTIDKLTQSLYIDANGRNYLDIISEYEDNYDNTNQIARAQRYSAEDFCAQLSAFNISKECCRHTKLLLASVAQKKMWALQMIDSFGKPASGILLGDFTFPGSYDECKSANVLIEANLTGLPLQYQPFTPKYCQVNIPINALKNMNQMFLSGTIAKLTTGVCTPNTCQASDIKIFIESGIHLLPFHLGENFTTVVNCEEEVEYDGKAIFSLVVCSIFVFIIILGTLYDIIIVQIPKSRQNDENSRQNEKNGNPPFQIKDTPSKNEKEHLLETNREPDTQMQHCLQHTKENCLTKKTSTTKFESKRKPSTPRILYMSLSESIVGKLLLCFSIYKNASKLLKTEQPKGSLTCIHGVRFLSMSWIILGHTYVFALPVLRNSSKLLEFLKSFTFQAIENATVSVDTFFLMSGMLVTYGCLSSMKAKDGKMNWLYFYCHRFWRLTPPFMLVMMVYIPLFRYLGDGPYWPQNGVEVNYCKETWYYNLLYINNFIPDSSTTGICMGWSWYLSNDMQFYVISPLLIVPFYRSSKAGLAVFFVLLLAQFITAGVISTTESLPAQALSLKYMQYIYMKPYTRIGPYLVGMVCGYYLYKNNCKMSLNRYICVMLWLMATVSAVSVLYGLYDVNNGFLMSQNTASFYTAVHRSVWGLCVGWVIYACCTGNGGFVNTILSWKAFIPLSRLTYCAYLVHPIVMYFVYYNQRYPVYITHITMVFLFLGFMVCSYMVAFIVSMAFEAPMLGFEALLLGKNKNKK